MSATTSKAERLKSLVMETNTQIQALRDLQRRARNAGAGPTVNNDFATTISAAGRARAALAEVAGRAWVEEQIG